MKHQISKKIKSVAASIVLASSSLALQSCTDEQVGTALTVVAAAAVVSTLPSRPDHRYNDGYDRDDRRRPGYGRPGYGRPGYDRPGYGRPGYGGDHRGGRDRGWHSVEQSVDALSMMSSEIEQLSNSEKIAIMSEKYGITTYAAEKLQFALDKAKSRDFSVIDEMGIARSDLQKLYENKAVSRYTQVNLGSALGLTFEQAGVVIQKFQQDIQTVKSASQMM